MTGLSRNCARTTCPSGRPGAATRISPHRSAGSRAAASVTSYVSDPAKPVLYEPRPVRFSDSDAWRTWLIRDQRFIDGRPDVLTYETAPLTEPVTLQGAPQVDLAATTTGTRTRAKAPIRS